MKEKKSVIFKEKKVYPEDTSPMVIYHFESETFYFRDWEPHCNEGVEILYIRNGTKRYHINDTPYDLEKGDIVYMHPCSIQLSGKTGKDTDSDFEVYVFVFDPKLVMPLNEESHLMAILKPLEDGSAEFPTVIKPKEDIYPQFKACLLNLREAYVERSVGFELELVKYIIEMYIVLYRKYGINNQEKCKKMCERKGNILKAIEYIHKNFNKELTIDELAKIAEFSPPHFMSLFKQYTGTSCVSYINVFRLDKAAYQLINTKEPTQDIAFACGYNNVSFFNRVFKKQFDETPRAFRKRTFL